MDSYIQRFLNRVSLVIAVIATLALLHLFSRSSLSCAPPPSSSHHHRRPQHAAAVQPKHLPTIATQPLPRSSCDSAARGFLAPEKRFQKLRASRAWQSRAASFSTLFRVLRSAGALRNASHVLCVSAGAGHEVAALQDSGVADVTGVDLIDFPPLVSRADPHNLPFFDSVFDLAFSAGLDGALFPARFVAELERTVRPGGASVVAVERCSSEAEVEGIKALFRRSSLMGVSNVTLSETEMTMIIMRNKGNHT